MLKNSHIYTFSSCKGFTIFEMIVVVSIASLLAYIAIPNYTQLNASIERMNVRKTVLQDLRRAQAESVTHGCRGIFKVDPGNKRYTFGCDYLAYDTTSPPSADTITFTRTLPLYFYIAADNTVIFNSKGQIVDEAHLIDSRTINLSETSTGSSVTFASGLVAGTGVFEYD